MSTLFSLDPGIDGCGLAIFRDGNLASASYVPSTLTAKGQRFGRSFRTESMVGDLRAAVRGYYPDIVVTECPQIYAAGKGKGNPNLLIPLAQIGAAFAMSLPAEWIEVLPREWKGTLDGDVMTQRIWDRLTGVEKGQVQSYKRGGMDHNILDAVGIGLYYYHRLEPKRIYAR